MSRLISKETKDYAVGWLLSGMESVCKRISKGQVLRGLGKYDRKWFDSREVLVSQCAIMTLLDSSDMSFRVPESGDYVYFFNGRYYERVSNPKLFIENLVLAVLTELEVGFKYHKAISDVVTQRVVKGLMFSDEWKFTPSRRYVVFTNGVYDLESGKLKEFSRRYETDIVLDIPYIDPREHYISCERKYGHRDNPCKLWDKFVKDVFPNDEIREAAQAFCGLMLIDRLEYKVEYMAIIYGVGANGKSVFIDSVKSVFGSRYISGFTPKELCAPGTSGMSKRYEVHGKLMNCTGDLDNEDFSGGDFKRIISGDADLQGNAKFSNEYIKVKFPLMVCCTNVIPSFSDDSYGHYRRLLPLPSTTKTWTGSERDPRLTAKLSTEDARTYIFSWILEGRKRVLSNNGEIPIGEEVRKAIDSVMSNSNSMRRWWSGYCRYRLATHADSPKQCEWINATILYDNYKKYCLEEGERLENQQRLGRMLGSLGLTKENDNKRRLNGYEHYYLCRKGEDE